MDDIQVSYFLLKFTNYFDTKTPVPNISIAYNIRDLKLTQRTLKHN